jgi:hypothetical protein
MDCPLAGPRSRPAGPNSWELSARTIDAFCGRLLDGGLLPTLFFSPEAADQHAPLCEDFASLGVDLGLLVDPPTLRGAGLKQNLGAYSRNDQQAIIEESRRRFEAAAGRRPSSVRSALYSASDETFAVLDELGFRQSSISSPGRRVPKHHAVWTGAPTEPHYASAKNRLAPGALPLLEVPVTTDATQCPGGIAPDLAIENGTLDRWHVPLIDGQLERQASEQVVFRTLCFVTSSGFAYHDRSTRHRKTLDALVEYVSSLEDHYEVVPATLAGTTVYYREMCGTHLDAKATT